MRFFRRLLFAGLLSGLAWFIVRSLSTQEQPLEFLSAIRRELPLGPAFPATRRESPVGEVPSAEESLRALYERNQNALDPADRSLAWQAWSGCVPNYLAVVRGGPADLAAGLPDDAVRASRLAARRRIAQLCEDFARLSPASLSQEAVTNAERHRAGDLRSRGEMAQQALMAGNPQGALEQAAEIFRRRSPHEMRDLSGFVARWHRQRPRTTDDLYDAVLAVIGCDFGMDCSENSLPALQLCADGGACEGDLVERTLAAYPEVDRARLNVVRVDTAAKIAGHDFDLIRWLD